MVRTLAFCLSALALCAAPLAARDSLGVFGQWGAFRDAEAPVCYAIASARPSRAARQEQPFVSISTWPQRELRGQVHFRLSRAIQKTSTATLTIGEAEFELTGEGTDVWAADRQMDAQIVAALRSGETMRISARDSRSRPFGDRYSLDGVAAALDAASLGCAQQR